MSRLTEHQIRALVHGMELTLAKYEHEGKKAQACRTRLRLDMYRALLAERVKMTDFSRSEVFCSQQTNSENRSTCPGFGGSVEAKNALTIAGENVGSLPDELLELGKVIGRRQAFGMLAASCSAADAQLLKRIKETAAYKTLGLTWDQFCPLHLGADRKTIERIIGNFEEFGAAYFNLRNIVRISSGSYGLIAAAVADDNTIEFDGEKIPITKANAARITDALNALRKTVDQKDEQLQERVRDTKKLRDERDAARKAAERERQAFSDYKKAQAERFPGAGEDFSTLLDAQSHFDLAMSKLAVAGNRELSEEDQARYIGLCEYAYRQLIQVTFESRQKFGKGWNMADQSDLLTLDEVAPSARNLMDEFTRKSTKK